MRKVGSDEYREHADYRRADALKQLKSDKKQWICGQGKQQCTDRQSPKLKLIAGRLLRLTQCAERRSRHDQLTNAAALAE